MTSLKMEWERGKRVGDRGRLERIEKILADEASLKRYIQNKELHKEIIELHDELSKREVKIDETFRLLEVERKYFYECKYQMKNYELSSKNKIEQFEEYTHYDYIYIYIYLGR